MLYRNDSPSPPPPTKMRKKKTVLNEVPILLKTTTADSPPCGRSPGKKVKMIKKKSKVARYKSSSSNSENESKTRELDVKVTDTEKIPSMYKTPRKRSNSSSSSSSRSPSPLVTKKSIKPGRETSASPSPAKYITKKRKDSEGKSKKKDVSGSSSDESIQTKIDKLRAKINMHNRTSIPRADETVKKNEKKPKQVENTNNLEKEQKELFTNKNFHESSLTESHAKVEQKITRPEIVNKVENMQSDNEDITSGLLETKIRPRVKEEKHPKKR